MRATILPLAIILTTAHRAAPSSMAKGCIVARVLLLRCFLFLLTKNTNFKVFFPFLFALFSYEPEVFLPKYSQTAILHAAHFQRVVKH